MLKKFFDKHILELIFIANHSMTQTIPITCAQNNSNRPALTGGMKRLYDSPGTAVELRPGDNVFDAHLATCGQRRRSRSTGRLLRRIFHVKQRLQAFEMPTLPLFYRHHSLAIARQRSSVMQRGGGSEAGVAGITIQPDFSREILVAGVQVLRAVGAKQQH